MAWALKQWNKALLEYSIERLDELYHIYSLQKKRAAKVLFCWLLSLYDCTESRLLIKSVC